MNLQDTLGICIKNFSKAKIVNSDSIDIKDSDIELHIKCKRYEIV